MRKLSVYLLAIASTFTGTTALASQSDAMLEPREVSTSQQAEDAITEMSAYLRSLPSFAVRGTSTIDIILDSGHVVQQNRAIELHANRPTNIWAKTTNAYGEQEFFFDGHTFTLHTADTGYYASTAVAENTAKSLIHLQERYDINIPLSDLFIWGTKFDRNTVTDAVVVGDSSVASISCTQYAFRTEDVEWQIWIQNGPEKLPRKLLIISTEDETRPRYDVTLDWNLSPDLSDTVFSFIPNETDTQISFQTAVTNKEAK